MTTTLEAHGIKVTEGSQIVVEDGTDRRCKLGPVKFRRSIRELPNGFKPGIYLETTCEIQPRDVYQSKKNTYQDLFEMSLLVEPDGEGVRVTDDMEALAAAIAWLRSDPARGAKYSELLELLEVK